MKKILSIAFALAALTQSAHAATESVTTEVPKNPVVNITVNPVPMLLGYIEAGADFKVSSRVALGAYVDFAAFGGGTGTYSSSTVLFGGGARANISLSGEALHDGWFVSPFAGFVPISSGSVRNSIFTAGALAGYQWFYDSGFTMSLGLGAKYVALSSNMVTDWYVAGILPAAEFRVGFAF